MNGKLQCGRVAAEVSAYLDGRLDGLEQMALEEHVAGCRACAARVSRLSGMRARLRSLPQRTPPPILRSRLRIAASHEILRRRSRGTLGGVIAGWRADLQLWTDNLMRPIALPAAGGLLSALLLFGVISSGMTSRPALAEGNDVPTGLFTAVSVKTFGPMGIHNDEIVVELTVDEQGRMVDYTVSNREALRRSPALRRSIENNLLFTQFKPATSFGQPTYGKIRISFRSSRIEVKG